MGKLASVVVDAVGAGGAMRASMSESYAENPDIVVASCDNLGDIVELMAKCGAGDCGRIGGGSARVHLAGASVGTRHN